MEIQGANKTNTGHIEAKDDFPVNSWNSWTKYGTMTVFFGGSNNGDVWVFPKIMVPPNHPF